jgi:hypothetical protein
MITVFRGDDLSLTFYFKDSAGTAIDLTGCTLFATVKSSVEDTDANAKLAKTMTISTPATAGIATLEATATEMLYLRGQYILDIQIKTAAGKIQTPFKSDFYVDEDVTIRTT